MRNHETNLPLFARSKVFKVWPCFYGYLEFANWKGVRNRIVEAFFAPLLPCIFALSFSSQLKRRQMSEMSAVALAEPSAAKVSIQRH